MTADSPAADRERAEREAQEAYEDLLGSIWLYVPWHFVTSQLTTEQKELWADAIDARSERLYGTERGEVERWWR